MARHLLDHDASQRLVMAKSTTTYLSSPSIESKPANIPGGHPSAASEETVQFMMVSSLLPESYKSRAEHRHAFLKCGMYYAYMQQAHGRSTHRSSTTTSVTPELLPVVQPMLLENLVNAPRLGDTRRITWSDSRRGSCRNTLWEYRYCFINCSQEIEKDQGEGFRSW